MFKQTNQTENDETLWNINCALENEDKYNLKKCPLRKLYKLFVLIKMNRPTSGIFAPFYALKYFHLEIKSKLWMQFILIHHGKFDTLLIQPYLWNSNTCDFVEFVFICELLSIYNWILRVREFVWYDYDYVVVVVDFDGYSKYFAFENELQYFRIIREFYSSLILKEIIIEAEHW